MVSIAASPARARSEILLEVLCDRGRDGLKPAGQSALEVSAGLRALNECGKQAARFFGAAETQAEKTGLRRDAVDEAFLAPLISAAREAYHRTHLRRSGGGGPYFSVMRTPIAEARYVLEKDPQVEPITHS